MPFNTPEKYAKYCLDNKTKRNKQSKDWRLRLKDSAVYDRQNYSLNRVERLQQAKNQYRKAGRARHLLKKYNLTIEQFDLIFLYQKSCCALCTCSEPGAKGLWYVDHCHRSQETRGILCLGCNRVLGYLETKPSLLEQCSTFKEYINNPPARVVLKSIPLMRPTETPSKN